MINLPAELGCISKNLPLGPRALGLGAGFYWPTLALLAGLSQTSLLRVYSCRISSGRVYNHRGYPVLFISWSTAHILGVYLKLSMHTRTCRLSLTICTPLLLHLLSPFTFHPPSLLIVLILNFLAKWYGSGTVLVLFCVLCSVFCFLRSVFCVLCSVFCSLLPVSYLNWGFSGENPEHWWPWWHTGVLAKVTLKI